MNEEDKAAIHGDIIFGDEDVERAARAIGQALTGQVKSYVWSNGRHTGEFVPETIDDFVDQRYMPIDWHDMKIRAARAALAAMRGDS